MNELTFEEKITAEINQVCLLISENLVVEVDPEIAEAMGCFEETALSAEEAENAIFDNELLDEVQDD